MQVESDAEAMQECCLPACSVCFLIHPQDHVPDDSTTVEKQKACLQVNHMEAFFPPKVDGQLLRGP